MLTFVESELSTLELPFLATLPEHSQPSLPRASSNLQQGLDCPSFTCRHSLLKFFQTTRLTLIRERPFNVSA